MTRGALRVGALVALVACGKETKVNPLDVFGSAIAPPAPFDTLKIGMSLAEAKAAIPTLDGDVFPELPLGAGLKGRVTFSHKKLDGVLVFYEHALTEGQLVAKWGAPSKDADGNRVWLGPAWRASFACKQPADCLVRFERLPRPLTAAFFGTSVAPPGALAPLLPRMPYTDAKQRAPALIGDFEDVDPDLGVDGVRAEVLASPDAGVLAIRMDVTPAQRPLLHQAWGEPVPTEVAGPPRATVPCWTGPTWRACVAHVHELSHTIEFHYRKPLASLLGEGAQLGAPLHPLLGATLDELAARGLGVGKRLLWTEVQLPETEYGRARLHAMPADDGTIEKARLELEYDDPQRDEMFAKLAARWGAPTKAPTEKERERDDFKRVLRAKAPRVELTSRSGAWHLTLTP